MGIRLEEIATWLRTVPSVAAVFGARIWAGEPLDDSQAGPYLVLDTVSQSWDSVNNRARVELRAVSNARTATRSSVEGGMLEAEKALVHSTSAGAHSFTTFRAYRVSSGASWLWLKDEKERRVLIHDVIIDSIYSVT
jgi:hypothetical protein